MRRNFLLTLGLAILGMVVVASTSVAGDSSVVGVGQTGVQINIPDGGDLPDVDVLPQCSNLVDDDGDGVKDLSDPDCSGPLDSTESGTSGVPTTPEQPTTPTTPSGGSGGSTGGGSSHSGGSDQGGSSSGDLPSPDEGTVSTPETQGLDVHGHHAAGDKPNGDARSDETGGVAADEQIPEEPDRNPDGTPTNSNPSLTVADFGPAPIGVPNFVIDQFTIPPFLLPIYQACGTQYGIPWEVLASINRIETAFGTNLNVSTAGAVGWMQFLPSTWKMYGVDANNDGRKDPFNPVDAICAAARYLRAAGGQDDIRRAVFAYNHADWYVDEVILYAKQYGNLPEDLIGSLTGLTEGARFPVAAKARYADDISERRALERSQPSKGSAGNAADVITDSPTRRGINIYSKDGAPVIAVNDGTITKIGKSKELGNYIVLRDAYGNRFTYAQLGSVAKAYPVPKQRKLTAKDFELVTPDDNGDNAPAEPASAGKQVHAAPTTHSESPADEKAAKDNSTATDSGDSSGPVNTQDSRQRLYAYPERGNNSNRAGLDGQLDSLLQQKLPGYETVKGAFSDVLRFDPKKMDLHALKEGSKVNAGTVLGEIGKTDALAPHVHFEIQPAGRGAPKIDPKPILDGWKLLEATAIYRAAGKNPFDGTATASQVLLMSKGQLIQRTLNDPHLSIYSCGREDIRSGIIDRRILATMEYLVARGYDLTITSLECGHSVMTTSGNVSEHSIGSAMDIAAINGQPVLGNQGPGTLADSLVRDLIQLQGSMKPHQIISLMDYFNADNTFAMADHDDHVHVGFAAEGSDTVSKQFNQILKGSQWERLIQRLGEIDNPEVSTKPSQFALPAGDGKGDERASAAHAGE
jgi:hypothetical protein